jgi:hypothetical protein
MSVFLPEFKATGFGVIGALNIPAVKRIGVQFIESEFMPGFIPSFWRVTSEVFRVNG